MRSKAEEKKEERDKKGGTERGLRLRRKRSRKQWCRKNGKTRQERNIERQTESTEKTRRKRKEKKTGTCDLKSGQKKCFFEKQNKTKKKQKEWHRKFFLV